jgi:hypothetical protein
MGQMTIQPRTSEKVGSKSQSQGYVLEAVDGDIRYSDRKKTAKSGKKILEGGIDNVRLERGDGLFVYNPTETTVTIEVTPWGLVVLGSNNSIQLTAQRQFDNGLVGQDTVSSAGSTVQLNGGSSQNIPRGSQLTIRALTGNGGPVYVGFDSGVDNNSGYQLPAGSGLSLPINDVSDLYVYGANSGDGVSWEVEQE